MASQATKMFAMFALLALYASATTATHVPSHVPPFLSPVTAMGAIEPACMQYCMMQQAFTLGGITSPAMMMLQEPWALPLQQCGMQVMMPKMMRLPQCHCGAIMQMMQQQQQMRMVTEMAMQMPFMFNAMTPSAFFNQPIVGGAFFQQPYVGCGF